MEGLVQGIANSAILCQIFVVQAIQIRDQLPQVYIIHCINDISLDYKNEGVLFVTYEQFKQSLAHAGLAIAPEKVQRQPPFHYFGHMLHLKETKPLKLEKER